MLIARPSTTAPRPLLGNRRQASINRAAGGELATT